MNKQLIQNTITALTESIQAKEAELERDRQLLKSLKQTPGIASVVIQTMSPTTTTTKTTTTKRPGRPLSNKNMPITTVRSKIQKTMKKENLSMAQMAERCEVSYPVICRIVNKSQETLQASTRKRILANI